jgi:hypothetical protein
MHILNPLTERFPCFEASFHLTCVQLQASVVNVQMAKDMRRWNIDHDAFSQIF